MDEACSIHRHELEKAIAVPTSKLARFSALNADLRLFLLGFCTIRQSVTGVGFPLIADPCRLSARCQFFVSGVVRRCPCPTNTCLSQLFLDRAGVRARVPTAACEQQWQHTEYRAIRVMALI
jgi:hypothetical protein